MDEIEQGKSALKEIHDFFKEQIKKGNLENKGFNDGVSEEYESNGVSVVVIYNEGVKTIKESVYYDGSEEFATVYANGRTSLDEENIDEIEKVLEVHKEMKEHMNLVNAVNFANEKNKNSNVKKQSARKLR